MGETCPSAEELDALLTGRVRATARADLEIHIDGCELCTALVAALAGADRPGERTAPTIDRYQVVEAIGQGAMGTVVRAHDPVLERDVAIKVLRSSVVGEEARARLLREAQVLASVDHPNVVSVFDTRVSDTEAFVAMELVDGQNLREWLAGEVSRDQVLEVFHRAALGLAAAHDAGVVHRDFKPENVMIGGGQVKVVDFGLASASLARAALRDDDSVDDVAELATRTRSLLGTPRYMAPEQLAGEAATAASDQFSFFVALFEALAGQRPFPAASLGELEARIAAGPPAMPRAIPRRLRRVIRRGLCPDPARRLASMHEVAAQLAPRPSGPGLALAAGSAAGLAVCAAAAVTLLAGGLSAADPCEVGVERISERWNADTRAALRRAFAATQRANAAETLERVEALLDDYVRTWRGSYRSVCEAGSDASSSPLVYERSMHCLEGRRRELFALTDALSSKPTGEVIDSAVSAASTLPDIAACTDVEALSSAYPLPDDPAEREEVQALGQRLFQARLSGLAGDYSEARKIAADIARRADELAYPPLLARALFVQGELESLLATGRAEEMMRRAARLAAVARDDLLAAQVWLELFTIVKDQPDRDRELGELVAVADAAIARVGSPDKLRSQWYDRRSTLALGHGKYDEARALGERAIELAERAGERRYLATVLNNVSVIARREGDLDVADAYLERAARAIESSHGANHPDLSSVLNNRAQIARLRGRYADARRHLARSLTILGQALPDDHPRLLLTKQTLGQVAMEEQRFSEAERLFRECLDGLLASDSPDPRRLIIYRFNLAAALAELARREESEALLQLVAADVDAVYGPEHPRAAVVQVNLAASARDRGDHASALAHVDRALAIRRKHLEPDHPDIARTLLLRAELSLLRGELSRVETDLRRAEAILAGAFEPEHPDRSAALELRGRLQEARGQQAPRLSPEPAP